jgi:hypothetical protein
MAQKDPNISRIRDEAAPRPAGAMLPHGSGGGATGTIRPSTSPRMPTSGFEGGHGSLHSVQGQPPWSIVNSAQGRSV